MDIESLKLDKFERESMLQNIDLLSEEELQKAFSLPIVFCMICGTRINPVRLIMCEGTNVCTVHARAGYGQPPPMRGMMIYDHKTAGEICIMPEKVWREAKRLTDRRGNMSILRKVSPSRA